MALVSVARGSVADVNFGSSPGWRVSAGGAAGLAVHPPSFSRHFALDKPHLHLRSALGSGGSRSEAFAIAAATFAASAPARTWVGKSKRRRWAFVRRRPALHCQRQDQEVDEKSAIVTVVDAPTTLRQQLEELRRQHAQELEAAAWKVASLEAERLELADVVEAEKRARMEAEANVQDLSRKLDALHVSTSSRSSSAHRPPTVSTGAELAAARDAIEAAEAVASEEAVESKTNRNKGTARIEPGKQQPAARPLVTEVVHPPGYYWKLPPQRFRFEDDEQPLVVGSWRGVEHIGHANNGTKESTRDFYCVRGVLSRRDSQTVLQLCESSSSYTTEPDSVDNTPAFEFYAFQHGEWVHRRLESILQPVLESRIMPYIREKYKQPDCAVADILVRRYIPGERRTHAVHFDGHAFVTAVLGISDPDTFEGGLFLQPGPDVASRLFIRLEQGDLLVHSFDLPHGVHIWRGVRYSLIFWVKTSPQAVRDNSTPWYDEKAARRDADAMYAMGMNHSRGSAGTALDIAEAIKCYERSARAGHYFAQNNLGILYKKAHQVLNITAGLTKSAKWLRIAADAGFAIAQRNLALAYQAGEGVERSPQEALQWMTRSAEQLDVEAAFLLGEMHREGTAGRVDLVEAVKWYTRSAKAGFPRAQYTLGALNVEGHGLPKDLKTAEAWFRHASRQGMLEASNNLASLMAQRGEVVGAAEIWATLADQGEVNAQCNIGMCYMRGLGRPLDRNKAKEWLEKAASRGHRMAAHALVML